MLVCKEKTAVPKAVAVVIMGAYADSIDFDYYDWFVEPYNRERVKDEDVFYTSRSFILSGVWNGKADSHID